MEQGRAVGSTCLHVPHRRRLQTKPPISREGVPRSRALYTHRSRTQKGPGFRYGGQNNCTVDRFQPGRLSLSSFPKAPGIELAAACLALSHPRAQRGSAGRAETSQAGADGSGREPGARLCPCLPGLRVPAAALTRRSSRAPSTRRAIAPLPPPRPRLGPLVPLGTVSSAGSPRARTRPRPGAPAPPRGAGAAQPRGAVPGVAAAGKRSPGSQALLARRWGIRAGRRRALTPAPSCTRTWDRDVPGWGL